MAFPKVIFWLHLLAGVLAGLVILFLCGTGAILALEKEWVGWADRSGHSGTQDQAQPLPLAELIARASEGRESAQASGVTLYAEPHQPWSVSFGRAEVEWIHPRTGALVHEGSRWAREWMRRFVEWHRWLGRDGAVRDWGKAITGAANVLFLFLVISGLVLWAPRRWTMESVKSALQLRLHGRGRARDWNWHTVAGFWMSPVLIVLTVSGLVISYRWAGNVVHWIAGSKPPAVGSGRGGGAGPGATSFSVAPPNAESRPLDWDVAIAKVQTEFPSWEQMTLRLPHAGRGKELPAISISIRNKGSLPQSGALQLWLDPFTGAVLKREGYADYDAGRRLRAWLRFLHTGEALGTPGRYIAALGCLVGGMLVWTGFALAWRRLSVRRSAITREAAVP